MQARDDLGVILLILKRHKAVANEEVQYQARVPRRELAVVQRLLRLFDRVQADVRGLHVERRGHHARVDLHVVHELRLRPYEACLAAAGGLGLGRRDKGNRARRLGVLADEIGGQARFLLRLADHALKGRLR